MVDTKRDVAGGATDAVGLWWVLVFVAGAIVTRWSIVTSPYTYMDGDEALMGLVVQHALEGRGIPLFPYGAEFGLSFFETGSGVLLASIFGLSETILNLSVFAVWCAGAACLIASVGRFLGARAALSASVIAVSTPAWFHFSNVSWGYHHSAFLMCHASVLVVACVIDDTGPRRLAMVLLGLFASLTFYSHPIFALALIPFLLWVVGRRRRIDDKLLLAGVFVACSLGYFLVRESTPYWAPATFANVAVVESLWQLPHRIWVSATGLYFLDRPLELGGLTRALTWTWMGLAGAAGLHALVRAVRARRFDLGVACVLSISVVYAFNLIVNPYQWGYRYLAATVGFEVILVARMLGAWQAKPGSARRWAWAGGALLVGLAVASSTLEVSRATEFSGSPLRTATKERDAMRELVRFLDDRGVGHVYSWGGMLQWQVMFESQDRIRARWVNATDRIPEYPPAVDRALDAGLPIAVFGEVTDLDGITQSIEATGVEADPILVADRYFVVLDPPRELVAHTFRLNE